MPRTDVRRAFLKVVVLLALTGTLFFFYSKSRAQTGPNCDNDYQYCATQCSDQYGHGTEAYYNCRSICDSSYFDCAQEANPPVGQPQRPCPPCLQECDLAQQQCLADGIQTPSQCLFTTYRCKQRCNYYCDY
jgi:hypothetical protein